MISGNNGVFLLLLFRWILVFDQNKSSLSNSRTPTTTKCSRSENKKLNQLEKIHFIKVNELKLYEVKFFFRFHFMCVASNSSESFCMPRKANIKRFLYHYNLLFKISNFICVLNHQLELMKINTSARRSVFSRKRVKFTLDELFLTFKREHI